MTRKNIGTEIREERGPIMTGEDITAETGTDEMKADRRKEEGETVKEIDTETDHRRD